MEEKQLRNRIIEAALEEFNDKGIKFTMDQIAKRLSISKKTIYTIFPDKETLLLEGVEHGFQMIKESENAVLENKSLNLVEKLKKVLIVLPERFLDIDFRRIYEMTDTYPDVYQNLVGRIDSGWEPTIALLEEGMNQGLIRRVSIPVFKIMVESSIQSFISNRELVASDISYEEALEEMIDILMKGMIP